MQRHSSSGFVLAFVLICLTIVTIALASMISRMSQGHRQVMKRQQQVQAQWLAESAVDRAAAQFQRDPSYRGETWQPSLADTGENGSAQIDIQIEMSQPAESGVIHVTVTFPNAEPIAVRQEKQVPLSTVRD